MKLTNAIGLAICGLFACTQSPPASDVLEVDVVEQDTPEPMDRPVVARDVGTLMDQSSVDSVEPSCAQSVMPRWTGVAPATSVVVAPGRRLDELRAAFAMNPSAQTLLARARQRATPMGPPTLALGDDVGFQNVSSTAVAHALVAWYDHDELAAQRAAAWISAMVLTPQWLARAPEVMIRVGASFVLGAAALDLLNAAQSASFDGARRNFALAAGVLANWAFTNGSILVAAHPDNHGVRMGGGLIASLPWTSEAEVPNRVERVAVAMVANAIDTQNRADVGWAEGSMYLQYALETPAISLTMLDALWTAPTSSVCVRCRELPLAPCGIGPITVTRPREWNALQSALRWLEHLQTARGQIVPVDDSRYRAPPAPLFERLTGKKAYPRWSPESSNGSVGQSHDVGPVEAFAVLEERPTAEPPPAVIESSGTSLLHHRIAGGAMIELALTAEPMAALGNGHEHDDPLSMFVYVNGETMLGGSGYQSYDTRGPYAAPEAHSLLTVGSVFPRVMEFLPSSIHPIGDHAIGGWTSGAVTIQRNVGFENDDVVAIDTITLDRPQNVQWFWHTRGMLDAGRTDRWTSAWSPRDSATCELQFQSALTLSANSTRGMHVDDNPQPIQHSVLLYSASVPAGISTIRWLFRCQ